MKLLLWNVRGLNNRPHENAVKRLIHSIMFPQETKIQMSNWDNKDFDSTLGKIYNP